MLERVKRMLRPRNPQASLDWLNPDIAIGRVPRDEGWPSVYVAGVRAVVDLRARPEDDRGALVRRNGMRYLRLCPVGSSIPTAEELQIVTSWVQERIAEGGRVLIHDTQAHFNDGLVAVASLIKSGLPAHLALLALRRAAPARALDGRQHAVLVRFASL